LIDGLLNPAPHPEVDTWLRGVGIDV